MTAMTGDFIEDKETDVNRLWIPDRHPASSSFRSRIRHWWFPLLIALVLLLLIVSLGVINAQSSKRMSSVENSVAKLGSGVQSLNSSMLQASEALKQLSGLEALSKSVTALKWTVEGIMNSSMIDDACPPRWELFGSSCYFFSRLPLTWNQSRDWCQQQASHLVILQTDEEWDFVTSNTVPQFYWIGLSDGRTGQWEWVDQTPYTVLRRRWVPGQPDNWDGGHPNKGTEDCAHLHNTGRLNDMHCYIMMKFVCERKSRKL
ncbi:C-type lectin domain family 10 member A-like isoform 2-T3 [Synchiropus picturatus]